MDPFRPWLIQLGFVNLLTCLLLSGCQKQKTTTEELSTGQIYKVGQGNYSTTFGIYDTSPESPDGSRIAYIRFLQEPKHERDGHPGELWLCDSDLTNHRKVCDVPIVRPHNGAQVFWVDDQTLGFHTAWSDNPRELFVVDASSGENRFAPIPGVTDVGHDAHAGKILFATDVRTKGTPIGVPGMYELDAATGEYTLLISVSELNKLKHVLPASALNAEGAYPESEWKFLHLMYSPNAERIAFRLDVGTEPSQRLRLSMKPDGSDVINLDPLLLHFRWYDDQTFAGHDRDKSRWLLPVRYSYQSEFLGTIANVPGNHYAMSPDRKGFLSESNYNSDPVILRYYHADDNLQTSQIIAEFSPLDVIWKKRYHVNPAFSQDGKRAYFHMPTEDGYNGTYVVQIKP
ncbi:hypothetical protein [Thalassobacterium sedimentorum]|nr:hypothetical protein [Coraliomargarita sp. SDUM461004]